MQLRINEQAWLSAQLQFASKLTKIFKNRVAKLHDTKLLLKLNCTILHINFLQKNFCRTFRKISPHLFTWVAPKEADGAPSNALQ